MKVFWQVLWTEFSIISLFSVLYTAERDVCVIVIFFKKWGPCHPGPSDATPMGDADVEREVAFVVGLSAQSCSKK